MRTHPKPRPLIRRAVCSAGLTALLLPTSISSRSDTLRAATPAAPVRFTQITTSGVTEFGVPYPDLTHNAGNISPSISDAGDVAFISDADLVPKGSVPGAPGNTDGSDELFLFRAEGAHPLVQLTNDSGKNIMNSATLSRDGGAIAFAWGRPGRTSLPSLPQIYLYLVQDRRFVRLTEAEGAYGFTAVSDRIGGRYRVAFARFRLGGPRIFTVDVTGTRAGDPVPIGDRPGRDPSISRDGRKIVYTNDTSGGASQIVLHTEDAGEKRITQASLDSGHASISADGKAIAFESRANLATLNSDENPEIFLYQGTTGRTLQITRTPDNVKNSSPTINGNGTRVAFLSDGNLVGKNADKNEEVFLWTAGNPPVLRQVTNTKQESIPTSNSGPYLASNGERVLFRSNANLDRKNADNSPEIYLASGL